MGWSIDLIKSRYADFSMKITLMQDYVNKFGMSKPLLRDIISRIAKDLAESNATGAAKRPETSPVLVDRPGRGRLAATGGRLLS
jgi:hypothetical protein